MKFHRITYSLYEDTVWVCEDCLEDFIMRHDLAEEIDVSRDRYGDLECAECGIHYDHEEMDYTTWKGELYEE